MYLKYTTEDLQFHNSDFATGSKYLYSFVFHLNHPLSVFCCYIIKMNTKPIEHAPRIYGLDNGSHKVGCMDATSPFLSLRSSLPLFNLPIYSRKDECQFSTPPQPPFIFPVSWFFCLFVCLGGFF